MCEKCREFVKIRDKLEVVYFGEIEIGKKFI